MRGEGPAALERLLHAYDASEGSERERLAALVDGVAGQRYATVSRLYWYTDLVAAQHAARASGKPILSLHLLGRLDEDLSCANSRFFRVALYANAELSQWLRDSFVLHWTSERPVPKLTVDFGDGRLLETTIAGNSAHYVLDADGRVLDVIPGLVTPQAFRQELQVARELDARLRELGDDAARRDDVMVAYHRARTRASAAAPAAPTLRNAEVLAVSKSRAELPAVDAAALGPRGTTERPAAAPDARALQWLTDHGLPTTANEILDARSRELLSALRPIDWRTGEPLDGPGTRALADAFAANIRLDTAQNLGELAPRIRAQIADMAARHALELDALDRWIYETVFLTPASDRWLGIATPGVFTGLPGDGVRIAG